jgi:hypothetical protein
VRYFSHTSSTTQPAQYVNPQDFAAKFGLWRDGPPPRRGSYHDDARGGPVFKADGPLAELAKEKDDWAEVERFIANEEVVL